MDFLSVCLLDAQLVFFVGDVVGSCVGFFVGCAVGFFVGCPVALVGAYDGVPGT